MKTYIATYYRMNPQHKDGGYETKSIIEAKSIASARKQARERTKCLYGSKILLDVRLADTDC